MSYNHEIRVAWGDCDPANIVYTARIPWFALDAIDGWWEHHIGGGFYHLENDLKHGTPFVRMTLDFHHPITPRHRLICRVGPTRLGTTSIDFRVEGYQDGTHCFGGSFTCVFVDTASFKKTLPPPHVSEIVQANLFTPAE